MIVHNNSSNEGHTNNEEQQQDNTPVPILGYEKKKSARCDNFVSEREAQDMRVPLEECPVSTEKGSSAPLSLTRNEGWRKRKTNREV